MMHNLTGSSVLGGGGAGFFLEDTVALLSVLFKSLTLFVYCRLKATRASRYSRQFWFCEYSHILSSCLW